MGNGTGPEMFPGVPMPGTGNDPMGDVSKNVNLGELLKKILSQSGQRGMLPQPGVGTQQQLQRAGQRAPMQSGPFENKSEGMQGFMYNVGAAVQNAVKAHKEKQITTAMNDWQILQQSWETAQTVAQQGGKDPQEIFQKLPGVKAIMEDPKKMKNMAKALQMDWLNPEKTTVYQEAAKRHAEQDKSGKMMKFFKQMMGKGGPQLNQQQKQQMGQEEAQKMTSMSSAIKSDPKVELEVAKLVSEMKTREEGIAQRGQDMQMRWMEHMDNLQQRKSELEMRMQDKELSREQQMEMFKDRQALTKEIASGNQMLKALAIQAASDRYDMKRQDALHKQKFLYQGKIVDGTEVPEDSWSQARPVKDEQAMRSGANNFKIIVKAFNNINDPKYDVLWDNKGANDAITQAMQHFGSEGGGGGVGAFTFRAPAGLSDTIAKDLVAHEVPEKYQALAMEYIQNLRNMQEQAIPLQMLEQNGRIGRGLSMQLGAMFAAMPGAGTMDSRQARNSRKFVKDRMDVLSDNFGGYDGELIGGVKPSDVQYESAQPPSKKKGLIEKLNPFTGGPLAPD